MLQRVEHEIKRLTPQRQEVLKVLVEHSDEYLSAEEIYHWIRTGSGSGGLATVYRTLDLFVSQKIVRRSSVGDGAARYAFDPDTLRGRRVMVCNHCGQVESCTGEVLADLESWTLREHGFVVDTHDLKLFGMCRNCLPDRSGVAVG